jgi:hypothetical protein
MGSIPLPSVTVQLASDERECTKEWFWGKWEGSEDREDEDVGRCGEGVDIRRDRGGIISHNMEVA